MRIFKVGNNSEVIIENTIDSLKERININCGDNCRIHIMGLSANNSSLNISLSNDATLIIGPNQLMNGVVQISMHEKSTIKIGEGCLWANCSIWGSDMHSIIDLESGKRINPPDDILIGNKVWIGYNAMILKGSNIQDGCIVGANAVVTRSTKNIHNSLIIGNPAKQVKSNVTWDLSLRDC
jgi:acetyltransferase-like isoleucine patch superfamily enzyme